MTFFIEDYFRDCKQKSASYSLFVKKKKIFGIFCRFSSFSWLFLMKYQIFATEIYQKPELVMRNCQWNCMLLDVPSKCTWVDFKFSNTFFPWTDWNLLVRTFFSPSFFLSLFFFILCCKTPEIHWKWIVQ